MTQMISWPYEILFTVSLIDIFVTFSNSHKQPLQCAILSVCNYYNIIKEIKYKGEGKEKIVFQ